MALEGPGAQLLELRPLHDLQPSKKLDA